MISLVLFTTRVPSKLAANLENAGFKVFEALAISEVLDLCEHERIDIVVIPARVSEKRAKVIQEHHLTIRLKPGAKVKKLIAELWRMFPEKAVKIQ